METHVLQSEFVLCIFFQSMQMLQKLQIDKKITT